jgi:hypothetical protein
MLGMAYGPAIGSSTDARDIVAASYSLTFDAASCRRVLAPSCRGHGVIPPTVVQTMQNNAGHLGKVVVVMDGYDDSDISAGVDAVLAEAARQGVERVLWLDFPTNVPYHQPLSTADVGPIYANHDAVLAAKAAANPMLAIAPWADYSAGHPDWFQPDGIHMNFPSGADNLARFIVAQLGALGPPRCAAPPAGDPVSAPAAVPNQTAQAAHLDALSPQRLVDTRPGDGDSFTEPLGAGHALRVPTDATDASAAVVNLTATAPCGDGYLIAYRCDQPVPLASNVNYAVGQTASALATVQLDPSGDFCVYSPVTTDLVVDLFAFDRASATAGLTPLGPVRLVDTRDGSGRFAAKGALAPNVELAVPVASAGVPVSASAVSINVTAVDPALNAYVRVTPCGHDAVVSNVAVTADNTVANAALVAVGDANSICVMASVQTDVVIDVTGWYGAGAGAATTAQTPTRLVDTRNGQGGQRLGAHTDLGFTVPNGGHLATMSVVAVNPAKDGYLAVHPCGSGDVTSTLNYTAGDVVANTATVALDGNGRACVSTWAATDVVVDLLATG